MTKELLKAEADAKLLHGCPNILGRKFWSHIRCDELEMAIDIIHAALFMVTEVSRDGDRIQVIIDIRGGFNRGYQCANILVVLDTLTDSHVVGMGCYSLFTWLEAALTASDTTEWELEIRSAFSEHHWATASDE